jgi:hypothetical protein
MTGTTYQKVVKIITPELDEIYTMFKNIQTSTHVFTARGKSLDNIGILLNFARGVDDSDVTYRQSLINIIYINTIAGTKESIRKLLSNYLKISEADVVIQETVPNYVIIQLPPSCEIHDKSIKEIIYRSIAAGVYVGVYYSGNYWDVAAWDETTSKWS